jgi:hypothetical protein
VTAIYTPKTIPTNARVAPALVLDLDGTVRYSTAGNFIKSKADIALFPGVEEKLWTYRDNGALILGVSNQGGLAFNLKTPEQENEEMGAMLALFERNPFDLIVTCWHHTGGPMRRADIMAQMGIEDTDGGASEIRNLLKAIGATQPDRGLYAYTPTPDDEAFALALMEQGTDLPWVVRAYYAGRREGAGREMIDFEPAAAVWIRANGFTPAKARDLIDAFVQGAEQGVTNR